MDAFSITVHSSVICLQMRFEDRSRLGRTRLKVDVSNLTVETLKISSDPDFSMEKLTPVGHVAARSLREAGLSVRSRSL